MSNAIAQSTGITTKFTPLREFGVDEAEYPVDQDNWRITHMFKLYPWENLFKEIKSLKTWGLRDRILDGSVKIIEPAWKALLSNKGIWPIMWREFPHSRYLLPSYFETDMSPEATALQTKIHVRKPIIGREGASVSIVDPDPRVGALVDRPSPYGEEGYIVQEFLSPEKFGQYYPVIGSWYIDDACGMAIRADRELITGNRSIFVPHYIGSLHW
ncbi:glutathionylspermidine synthase family protein [Aetokthonos hydrillicola Thurmond2011]|uniref:Glutathionylspermidine synthase family protein n=1 Tax=Aetokthonos hydrillicola Thurmond2011 TaxID=2712845 RepID=A0AAP5I9M2_9CYAN|nr:glutathionylspermidine synthase family protein [Aetokthonos hydrillicola]MBW4586359.1 glutathionylspermidine synthase family protein [Aetokthonos hydrillicola CCALA 1050]MDR9897488.1 glutathionylspermidine synthase family protein [Aetokthonos hydrillicola Thurmond2011]